MCLYMNACTAASVTCMQDYIFDCVFLSKRAMAPSARVWLKSALLERELGAIQETLELLDEGLKRYPAYAKFYMMAGQVCMSEGGPGLTQTEGGPGRAREYFHRGDCKLNLYVHASCVLM